MCTTIVPLAGPDFYSERFGIRPLYPVGDSSLIEHVLARRPWLSGISRGEDQLIFVLRQEGAHTETMRSYIAERYPSADTVILGSLSLGAPLSVLAGIAVAKRSDAPVVVDLADIAFEMSWDPVAYFRENETVDAVVPYFHSQDPKFSYLRLDGRRVLEAREKQVISTHASAGAYAFRDVPTYLRAATYCLSNPDVCKVGQSLFVCPSVNGLITEVRQVHAIEVENVDPISAVFHQASPGISA